MVTWWKINIGILPTIANNVARDPKLQRARERGEVEPYGHEAWCNCQVDMFLVPSLLVHLATVTPSGTGAVTVLTLEETLKAVRKFKHLVEHVHRRS